MSMTLCRFLMRALKSLRAGEEGCSWVLAMVQTEAESGRWIIPKCEQSGSSQWFLWSLQVKMGVVVTDSSNRLYENALVSS